MLNHFEHCLLSITGIEGGNVNTFCEIGSTDVGRTQRDI